MTNAIQGLRWALTLWLLYNVMRGQGWAITTTLVLVTLFIEIASSTIIVTKLRVHALERMLTEMGEKVDRIEQEQKP